jgi:capsular polysaccharide biosynthesis protein
MGCICLKAEIEAIDLTYLFNLIKKKLLWIILAVLLGSGIMYAYVHFFVSPTYTAVISFCVSTRPADHTISDGSGEELTRQQQVVIQDLMQTNSVILKHKTVTESISDRMNGKYSANQISSMISFSIPESSFILDVFVTADNPEDAQLICNYIDEYGTDKVQEITRTYIRSLKAADLPAAASTPVKKYVLIGALLGLAISCAIIVIIGMLDTTVKSEEEFKKRIDIPVLGKIPSMKSVEAAKRKGY